MDLSRNKSLRRLEIRAKSLIPALKKYATDTVPSTFRAVISTINSPAFSEVVVIYSGDDFNNVAYSRGGGARSEDEWYREQFGVFREIYKARDFRLVLRGHCLSNRSARELERAVAVGKTGVSPLNYR